GGLRLRHTAPRRGHRSRSGPARRPGAPRARQQRAGHDRAHRPLARGRLHPPDRGRGRGPAADGMTPRKVWAIARKELRQASRDPLTLTMLLGVPTMMLLLYGYAINFDVRHVRLAVQDLDKSARSRNLVASFVNSTYFDQVADLPAGADIERVT